MPGEKPCTAGRTFDPQRLTTDASVNRLVVAALPGVPDDLAGRHAHDVLSADAVAALAAGHGVPVAREAIADDLAAALHEDRPGARAVVGEVALRLASVLRTLADPGTAEAQGWNPWRRAYLRHWAAVREVHLAGGLLAGAVGPFLAAETNAALDRLRAPTRTALMPWPARAALVGAVLRLGLEAGEALAVDLGGSSVKAALVRVASGLPVDVVSLPPTPVPFRPRESPPGGALDELLMAALARAVGNAVRRPGAGPGSVAFSVACYLGPDRRCADRGVYANLPDLAGDGWRARLAELLGRAVDVGVFHDGTAAAAAPPAPGGRPDAVLVLGSALGVGFPPRSCRA